MLKFELGHFSVQIEVNFKVNFCHEFFLYSHENDDEGESIEEDMDIFNEHDQNTFDYGGNDDAAP